MAPRTVYASLQDGFADLLLWDKSLADMGSLGVTPCTAAGANAIVLTPIAAVFPPNVTTPQALQAFSFVAAANSTAPITIQVGTIPAAKLYRMDGVTQATTGDLTASVLYLIGYNAALNSGAGGFQILAPISNEINPIISGATITNSTYNGNTWTTGTGILTIAALKTLTVNNSLTLAGTDATIQTFPSTSGTVVTSASSSAVTNAMAAQMAANTLKGNVTGSTANATDFTIDGLTLKASPAAGDELILWDVAGAAIKKATVASVAGGTVTSIAGNTGAFTLTGGITNSTNAIQLSLTNATVQVSPSNPTATASTTGVMMGLGSTAHITPVYSGRVRFEIIGALSNTAVGAACIAKLHFGTGTAPTNGTAFTGTLIGNQVGGTSSTAGAGVPLTLAGIVTGLSPGTAYWFDINLAATSGTASIITISCNAMEF